MTVSLTGEIDGLAALGYGAWIAAACWGLLMWFTPNAPLSRLGMVGPFSVPLAVGLAIAIASQRWYVVPVFVFALAFLLYFGTRSAKVSALAADPPTAYDSPDD